MFTAPDLESVAAIALDLVTSFGEEPSTRPRGGISAGEVMFRLGDLYGTVVNTAARLVDAASPGQVLTDVDSLDATHLALTPDGTRELKGFDGAIEVWAVSGDGRPGGSSSPCTCAMSTSASADPSCSDTAAATPAP